MPGQKTLYILRHAKAEVGAPGQDDRDRCLTERGVEAARTMGKYMNRKNIRPQKVLCSGARRTRDTWKHLTETYKEAPPVEYNDKLYLSSAGETLNVLSTLPETVQSLLVLGHNPGFHQLCLKLARKGDDKLHDLLALKFPTCALATFTFSEPWFAILQAQPTLTDFITPKLLASSD